MSKGSPIRQIRMDEEIWARIQRAAADEGARRGKPYSASEWIRAAVDAGLENQPHYPSFDPVARDGGNRKAQ